MAVLLLPLRLLKSAPLPLAVFRLAVVVAIEGALTHGRVEGAGGVVPERRTTGGRVERAERVIRERLKPSGRVFGAFRIVVHGPMTNGRVFIARRVASQRLSPELRVLVLCLQHRQERKASELKCN